MKIFRGLKVVIITSNESPSRDFGQVSSEHIRNMKAEATIVRINPNQSLEEIKTSNPDINNTHIALLEWSCNDIEMARILGFLEAEEIPTSIFIPYGYPCPYIGKDHHAYTYHPEMLSHSLRDGMQESSFAKILEESLDECKKLFEKGPYVKGINYKLANGVGIVTLKSWDHFNRVINLHLQNNQIIFRGQRQSSWKLESTLKRQFQKRGLGKETLQYHLSSFKMAIRGRIGPNSSRYTDDEWWSLGQHYGLATPLLDWTSSPYVALFFAFVKDGGETQEKERAVFCLDRLSIESKNIGLPEEDRIRFYNPETHDNRRLLHQSGMFTISPVDMDIEEWVSSRFKESNYAVLLKINIPNDDRDKCLTALNRMNINNLTLFPEIDGACSHCNLMLELENY